MREVSIGFELRSIITEGLTVSAGTVAFVTANPTAAKDFAGNGGSYSLQGNASTTTTWYMARDFDSGRALRHYRGRFKYNPDMTYGARFYLMNGTTVIYSIRMATNGVITLNNQAGTVQATASSPLTGATWNLIEFEIYHATSGFVKIFLNGDYTTPFVQYSGDTRGTGGTLTTITRIGGFFDSGTTAESSFDDIAINSLSLRYDGGSGTLPAAGNTLEVSGASGRNCVITSVSGTAAGATVLIENYSGTLFPLTDNTVLTVASTGWTGSLDAPNSKYIDGLEPQSYFPRNRFIVNLPPTGAGGVTGLTPSAGSNWAAVDDLPVSTADYVSGVDPNYDLYTHGSVPATAVTIDVVTLWSHAQKDSTYNNFQLPFSIGGTTYTSRGNALSSGTDGQLPLQVGYATQQINYAEHPNGVSGTIGVSSLNSSEFGFRVRT